MEYGIQTLRNATLQINGPLLLGCVSLKNHVSLRASLCRYLGLEQQRAELHLRQ
eukprot:m.203524 g.203524  ORF g.203524 m.203524 type:complete len:54 (+) comp10692_c0_seq4:1237-1398(+)